MRRDLWKLQEATAQRNRHALAHRNAVALNLVSSPGAGKTTLLETSVARLAERRPVVVIEGDQQTDRDARRLAAAGAAVTQINTGAGCHLDAAQVECALRELPPPSGAVVLIENVGNLICPAGFDLGQSANVVLLSVTEGEDKPAKYPDTFRRASAMVLTKIDLLPHLDFDRERCLADARALNPALTVFELSARTQVGLEPWLDWIASRRPDPRPR
jgi:hydrogenase nickel incorporation protein HypB